MKRLLLTLCCTLTTALFADTWTDPETNITWTYTLSNGTVSLGEGCWESPAVPTSYAGTLTIPATINGSPVGSLNDYAFYECSSLTSVVIPEGVTSIGSSAFSVCSFLTSVVIPEGVTSIGRDAFSGCSSLTSVVIPEGVTSIRSYTFSGCSSLISVVIPKGVVAIEDSAFHFCTSLIEIDLPEGVTVIGSDAFYYCSSLTSIDIPDGVTTIGHSAFLNCSNVETFRIPASVSSMPLDALPSFRKMVSVQVEKGSPIFCSENNILYNASKTILYHAASRGLSGIVTLPDTVLVLSDYAFYDCSSITSIVIPVGVTSIGREAFWGCSSLTSVSIPEGVISIEEYTFNYCSSLISVIIPEGVASIGAYAFRGCTSLISVVIPSSVTSIEERSFDSCSRLKEVTFLGDVPEGWGNIYPTVNGKQIYFSQAYAGKWNAVLSAAQRGTILELISKAGVTVTAEMTTPKTMRVTYAVESELPTVKVRAVAWKDGVRSFANIVLVKTAAEGSPEAVPNGGEVTTGVEHTFVWQVSADWATDLDKVAMEILVEEGTLLPQEKITIPALGEHPAMTITRNRLEPWRLFDALVWCYAEGDDTLTVTDGVVVVNGAQVASGDSLTPYAWGNSTALLNYLYGKMGYKVLAGEDLAWAKAATRLELADSGSGLDQVSVKITEE